MATALRLLAALVLAVALAASASGDSSSQGSSGSSESDEAAVGADAPWALLARQVCPHPPRIAVTLDQVRGSWFVVETAGPEVAADGRCHTIGVGEDGDQLSLTLSSFVNGSLVAQRNNLLAPGDDGMWVDRGEGGAIWLGRSRNGRLLLLCGLRGVGVQGRQPSTAFSMALAPVPRVDEGDLRGARGAAGDGLLFARQPLLHCRPPTPPASASAAPPPTEDEAVPDIQLLD